MLVYTLIELGLLRMRELELITLTKKTGVAIISESPMMKN